MSTLEIKFETGVIKGTAKKTFAFYERLRFLARVKTTSVFLAFSSGSLKSGLMLRESRRRETAKWNLGLRRDHKIGLRCYFKGSCYRNNDKKVVATTTFIKVAMGTMLSQTISIDCQKVSSHALSHNVGNYFILKISVVWILLRDIPSYLYSYLLDLMFILPYILIILQFFTLSNDINILLIVSIDSNVFYSMNE